MKPFKPILSTRPVLVGFIVFGLVLAITQLLTYQRYLLSKNIGREEISKQANLVEKELQTVLNQGFTSTQTLAFLADNYGVPKNFDSIAKLLLKTNEKVDALELVNHKGVITHVYPFEGNEVLGFNILQDSIGKSGALETIQRKDYFVTGPIRLNQGGSGIVCRTPIFNNDTFNGFAAAVIRLPSLLSAIPMDNLNMGRYSYQLAKINEDGSEELFFSSKEITISKAFNIPITTRKGEWKLYVISNNNSILSSILIFGILGFLLSTLAGIYVTFILNQPIKLKKLVKEKTTLLEVNKEKYKLLVEQASDGIFLAEFNGNIIDANPMGAQMFGYEQNEILQKNLKDLITKEELLRDPIKFSELKEGATVLVEREMLRKDGGTFYGEVKAKSLPNNTILGIARDSSERKKSEKEILELQTKMNAAIRMGKIGYWSTDLLTGKIDWSQRMYEIYNVPLGTNIDLDYIRNLILPEDLERQSVLFEEKISTRDNTSFSYRIKYNKNSIKHISHQVEVVEDEKGQPIKLHGTTIDITEQKQAKERLEAQNIELQKTNSELDSFVYSASHELRAPLTSILGLVDIIKIDENKPKLLEKLTMMENSIKRLDTFIKDIIEFSRNRHLELNIEKINFCNLIDDSLESLWYLENTSNINIIRDISVPVDYYSDKRRVTVILNNFISNAIKYHHTKKTNPTIWITITSTNDNAKIVVKDNGPGINNSHLSKIFDMFYRTSSKIMGSGIGLYIVKEIIDKLNGSVKVDSEINKGATFTVILPNESLNYKKHGSEKSVTNR